MNLTQRQSVYSMKPTIAYKSSQSSDRHSERRSGHRRKHLQQEEKNPLKTQRHPYVRNYKRIPLDILSTSTPHSLHHRHEGGGQLNNDSGGHCMRLHYYKHPH
jgi:hypothetical protein